MEKVKCIEVDIRNGWEDAESHINKILEELKDSKIIDRKLVPAPSGKAYVLIAYEEKKKFKE